MKRRSRFSTTAELLVLPRDAMHERCLCRRAMSVCLSVCPSCCLSRPCVVSKRVIVSSIFFTVWYTPFLFFGDGESVYGWRSRLKINWLMGPTKTVVSSSRVRPSRTWSKELPKHQDRGSCCVDLAKFM